MVVVVVDGKKLLEVSQGARDAITKRFFLIFIRFSRGMNI